MNGGRLSDEEAMAQGLGLLRQRLASAGAEAEAPQQALRMIAMRFPEEAERIEALWADVARPEGRRQIEHVLAEVERQYAEDCAEA